MIIISGLEKMNITIFEAVLEYFGEFSIFLLDLFCVLKSYRPNVADIKNLPISAFDTLKLSLTFPNFSFFLKIWGIFLLAQAFSLGY